MSKILITGNGFDLFHHLPTKYEHFILVMKTIEEIEINEKVEFDDLFGHYFKQVTNIDYNYIKENYFADEIIFDKNKILEIRDKLSSNALYKHFKNILEIDTWIDFENEIENILYQVSSLMEYFNEAEVGQKYFDRNLLGVYINFSVFGFCENGPTKSRLNDEYIDNRTRKFNGKKFLTQLAVSLNEFTDIFNCYLSNIVSFFYEKFKSKVKIPVNYIDFNVTFNYTPTIQKIYNIENEVTYLHGKIDADNLKQNIILGVSDIPKEINDKKAFDFSKKYQKILKDSNNIIAEIPNDATDISEENIFYFLGHSLDKSDKDYINDIFKFLLKDYTEYSKIIVFYINQKDKENKIKNLFSYVDQETVIKFNRDGRLIFVEISEINIENQFNKSIWKKYDNFTV